MQHIYLDHASTTPLIDPVIEEMNIVMRQHFGNASSIHHHGRQAKMLIENARKTIAQSLGASIGEIFFCSSATEAHNMILTNAISDLGVTRIISSPLEHHCIIHTLDHLAKVTEVEIIYLDVDQYGTVDLDQLQNLLADDTKTLVSLMYVNNEIGNILDLNRVSEICVANHALLHCDTVQGIGKLPLNVNDTPMAFLAGSAHKFNGPKGVGFFYMNGDNIITPMMYGGAQERNMRAGTENIIGITGMSVALEKAIEQKEERAAHIQSLNQHMRNRLDTELDDIIINGTNQIDNILSVSFPATDKADMLMFNLDISRISASSGSACSSGIEHDSHVLQKIGHPSERKTIRFSFSHFNTIEEIDFVIEKLKKFTPIKVLA